MVLQDRGAFSVSLQEELYKVDNPVSHVLCTSPTRSEFSAARKVIDWSHCWIGRTLSK